MAHIAINLLPIEFTQEEIKNAKFYRIQAIGVGIIFIMTFLASLTIALRILQSHNITQVRNRLTLNEMKISDLKNTQATLLLLKNRLTTINQYLGISSEQTSLYNLVEKLVPPSVTISGVSISKAGDVVIVALIPDGLTLDNLVTNLSTKEKNEGKIALLSIDSLNRGRDGVYRASFKIKAK